MIRASVQPQRTRTDATKAVSRMSTRTRDHEGANPCSTHACAGKTGHDFSAIAVRASEHAADVLSTAGQPLDPAIRESMESRFGRDFRTVRVHLDADAAASARSLRARAYTSGNHIAFARDQFRPHTPEGDQLLAHELAHTMHPQHGTVFRKFDFTQPTPTTRDPIPLVVGGSILGNTDSQVNGHALPTTQQVWQALQPTSVTVKKSDTTISASVDPQNIAINVSAKVRVITAPTNGQWAGAYSRSLLRNPPAACTTAGNGTMAIELRGKPNSTALHDKVRAHEQEHVTDLEAVARSELLAYHDFLTGLVGHGTTDKECSDDLFRQVGTRDATAAQHFIDKWNAAVTVYDAPGGTHHSRFVTNVDQSCSTVRIAEQ